MIPLRWFRVRHHRRAEGRPQEAGCTDQAVQQALQARDRLVENLLLSAPFFFPSRSSSTAQPPRCRRCFREGKEGSSRAIEEYRTEILAEELAKKNGVQVGQQELFDYIIRCPRTTMDINRLFSDPSRSLLLSSILAVQGPDRGLE